MTILPENSPVERLALLEQQVGALQEQLAQLALQLLQERLRLQISPVPPETMSEALHPSLSTTPAPAPRSIHPADVRGRERTISRIEYNPQEKTYIPVCPRDGTLALTPDSPEWFDWLASITSFRFEGLRGHFTAYRDTSRGKRTRTWIAHRCIRGHNYKHYLGITDRLTVALLEKAAAQLQSRL